MDRCKTLTVPEAGRRDFVLAVMPDMRHTARGHSHNQIGRLLRVPIMAWMGN